MSRTPLWWHGVKWLQWALFLVAVTGGLWLAGLAFMAYLQMPTPGTPEYRGFPVPTLMLLGGVVAGVVVAMLSRMLSSLAARRRARSADRRLRAAISEVTEQLVIEPIEAEIAAYRSARDGLQTALR